MTGLNRRTFLQTTAATAAVAVTGVAAAKPEPQGAIDLETGEEWRDSQGWTVGATMNTSAVVVQKPVNVEFQRKLLENARANAPYFTGKLS